ncbi:hypothetical protein JFP55_pK0012 (plasmid) [Clostridium perfringens]|uniref:hypothetical protein n=1 Tax=Clostridium perfringens TaxID=1502 RepID=UPI0007765232|nr:hypothetical protein [Clostridium perfringens]AMN30911.1 hypothetical protein JFP55_pK0012 [Clostridium perfringens]
MESITLTELETINAGGWREAGKAFVGTLGIATGVGLSIASIACPPLIETGIGLYWSRRWWLLHQLMDNI